eukprot:scaffold96241_cov39-Phaeocystis_antarctica.AAC.1
MGWRLQPYVMEAATLRDGGCNPTSSLQRAHLQRHDGHQRLPPGRSKAVTLATLARADGRAMSCHWGLSG